MFNKILVIYNEKLSPKHLRTVKSVKEILHGRNFSIAKSHNLKEDFFDGIDLVVTIGGDGTFIRAARFLKDTPILGINSEPQYSEGALTSIMENEISCIKKILDGEYNLIKRCRAQIKRNGILLNELALNEVYIGTSSQFHTSRYTIKFQGRNEEHRSSGILIATGSGSNAWYKSARGAPFDYGDNKLKFIIREPYFGNRIFKPKILEGEITKGEKITFKSNRHEGGIIAIDANVTYDFNIPDIVEIELSDKPLNTIIRREK